VLVPETADRYLRPGSRAGFSLLELMAALALLLLVSGVVMSALMRMITTQGTISNRTEMHTSVRSATELLQQEIGQAGRISLPGTSPVTLTGAVLLTGTPTAVGVSSSAGMFVGEQLVIDSGANKETVQLTLVAANQITAIFFNPHASGAAVNVMGAFASGIVPTNAANGSTGSVLKLYGDINGDGNMVYIEYTCDTANNKLYRNVMAWNAASKPAKTDAMILLPNILPNPGGTNCFTYQQKTVGADTYVVDVAVTLTVQTQNPDPQTHQYQTETKALLNVSPRNIFESWQLASGGVNRRIQPMPPTISTLIQ
jgi:prepilin-type N-terminal cleavage/methylation domain-containing protein